MSFLERICEKLFMSDHPYHKLQELYIETYIMSKQKGLMNLLIRQWAKDNSKTVVPEHRFHPQRMWRADFAVLDLKVLIEYEGLIATKSRHTTLSGFTGDTEKYNQAQLLGWKVFRYTALNYSKVINDLDGMLALNGKKIREV